MKKSLKKIISLFLSALLLTCGMTQLIPARASNDDFVMDGTTLLRYEGNDTVIVIPPELGVTKIDDNAFCGMDFEGNLNSNASITSVTIPEGVTHIGMGAFMGCQLLKTLNLPLSLMRIDDCAFMSCSSLESVSLPETTTQLGSFIFGSCTKLASVNLSSALTEIPDSMFFGCTNLKSFTISQNITKIGSSAFLGSGLTSIIIPQSVLEISPSAFSFCQSLSTVVAGDTLKYVYGNSFGFTPWIENQPDGPIYIGRTLYGYNGMTPPDYEFSIREGTCFIALNAFQTEQNTLEKLSIPASVEDYELGVFDYCPLLTEINVSPDNNVFSSQNGVLFSDDSTILFQYPLGKTGDYTVPAGVETIGTFAFQSSSVSGIVFPDGLTEISDFAFCNCNELTEIDIPDSVTYIGASAFAECASLTEINLPSEFENLGFGALENTGWLNAQPDGPVYIGTFLYSYKGEAPENTTVTVRDGTTVICGYAFMMQTNIVDIIFPASVKKIGFGAFEESGWFDSQPEGIVYVNKIAVGLKYDSPDDIELVLADDTVGVAEGAFMYAISAKSFTIPQSVTFIGIDAFVAMRPDFVLKGYKGSCAETYANENGIPFISLSCEHELGEWTVDTVSTYTTHGSKSHHCTLCGEKFDITELPLLGDTNGDGRFNALDLLRLKMFLSGKLTADFDQKTAADLTGDGVTNALDLLRIKMKLSGKI